MTTTAPLKTFNLVSLGCAKNTVDLQVMVGHLIKKGFQPSTDPESADILIVNTCAFIESARAESIAEMVRASLLKSSGNYRAVVVTGCMVQRFTKSLVKNLTNVDAFVGIDALDKIAEVVAAIDPQKPQVCVPENPHKLFNPPKLGLRLTGIAHAYLKIAEGCAHACTYCVIPSLRGPYRSRLPKDILKEAKVLLSSGVRELNVIAQDPMLYGVDLKNKRINLVSLLKQLDTLEGDFHIRVLYSYPSEITDEFLNWMATSPHALRYVDVPIQHTVPAILKAMGRESAIEATLAAAERIRAAVPGVTLRTTVMTGFPGETEEDFRALLAAIRRMKFDHLGCFAFSSEIGTKAHLMRKKVPGDVAEKRCRQVMRTQRTVWLAKAKKMIGATFPALVVAPGVARIASQAPEVDGVTYLKVSEGQTLPTAGSTVNVRLTAVKKGYDFEGTICA